MHRRHTPPRAHKGPRPVTAQLDPAVLSERAAAAARGLVLGGVPPEAIARAVTELEAIAALGEDFGDTRRRLQAWAARPDHQRHPRLARLLRACAAGAHRPEELRAQLRFLRRIRLLAGFAVALDLATSLERDRAKRSARQQAIRKNHR